MGVRAVPQPVRLDRKENLEVGWSVGGLRLARNMDKTCWVALSMLQLLAVRTGLVTPGSNTAFMFLNKKSECSGTAFALNVFHTFLTEKKPKSATSATGGRKTFE